LDQKEPIQTPLMVGCYSKISKNAKNRKLGVGDLYSGGVTKLLLYNIDKFIIGTGDGTVELVTIIDVNMKVNKKMKIPNTPQIKTVSNNSFFLF
jgi:hypothetical protein